MLLAASGCLDSGERGQFQSMGPKGWPYADTIAIATDSALRRSDVAIALRHANSYQYSDIWVELSYTLADDPDSLRIDTLNIRLADEFGRWLGDGIGVGYQYIDTVKRALPLAPGSLVKLRHIMRADTLPGIEQAGLIVKN